jgi:hypothetical protein
MSGGGQAYDRFSFLLTNGHSLVEIFGITPGLKKAIFRFDYKAVLGD